MNAEDAGLTGILRDEQYLRLLVECMEDPMWIVGPDHKILECNTAFTHWCEHFTGRKISKGDHVLLEGEHKIYADKFEVCYKLAFDGKDFKSVEDMLIKGATHYTSVSFRPIFDVAGTVIAVGCTARDITEQRRHLFRIEKQNSTLREIAFIESHKIRGPVATILGLEQFFNYDNLGDPVNREIMEGVKTVTIELDLFIREVVRMSNEIEREDKGQNK
ncbi:MAG: PAS domain-containing protein [Taibaiella sp.]|nr:PAS domain-containing protein [Taibaiella sp.]